MKISLSPYHSNNIARPQSGTYGTFSTASYKRIVSTMIAAGELQIEDNEYISAVVISDYGLDFQISKRKEDEPSQ